MGRRSTWVSLSISGRGFEGRRGEALESPPGEAAGIRGWSGVGQKGLRSLDVHGLEASRDP
jgi:hypothetical protein